ncbi:MAG: hypothetical protein ACXQTD_07465 [Candidatus Syntropharchaeia archaeon]
MKKKEEIENMFEKLLKRIGELRNGRNNDSMTQLTERLCVLTERLYVLAWVLEYAGEWKPDEI